MKSSEELVPNERLRRVRSLKGWSQADLAEQVGTSYEMVSRWERGVTVPSFYYRERLCAALGQSAEELGLLRGHNGPITPPSSPLVFFASSHEDAEKAIVSQLKSALQERGFTLWSNRQVSRQGNGTAQTTLREIVRTAQVILVIVSPEARASRHVREALEAASRYQRPVCGVWIEGERWQECLPKGNGELAAPIDARGREDAVLLEEIASALEQAGLTSGESGMSAPAMREVPLASQPAVPTELVTPQGQATGATPPPSRALEPTVATPLPADMPLLPLPPSTRQRRGISRRTAGVFLGLVVLVIAGGILGSLSLLAHFGVIGTRSDATTPVRGGTWIDDFNHDIESLIPNGSSDMWSGTVDQALYLPLFYGDAQGLIHPGAATEVPTVQNGGISVDAKTWTLHLKPRLVWSDGQPYDARDVDYTWQLWRNPKFGAANPLGSLGLDLIGSAEVSADYHSITFHLKQPFAPFLADLWVDGFMAPLPAHHFSAMAPEAILKSPENLKPTVTSGPFILSEGMPGCDYIVVRNPRYYRAGEGLPYLDKVVFRVDKIEARFKDLQAGSIDSVWFLDIGKVQQYQRFSGYTLITPPASAAFEAMYFNFHNTVLASHPEVLQAMAMAIDHQALIDVARHSFASPLCTDHPSALHPGYDPAANCPVFDPAVANQLLDDNGWVKGADGIRTQAGQRLEFEYSTPTTSWPIAIDSWRIDGEAILQRNLREIGIQLDIQNYPGDTFFGPFLNGGKASPPTGAVAGRYDIAEFEDTFGYDPDDSYLLSCNQFPPKGRNYSFYCNPAVDDLYKQEVAGLDPSLRQNIFQQIHDIYLTQLPFIVLGAQITPSRPLMIVRWRRLNAVLCFRTSRR